MTIKTNNINKTEPNETEAWFRSPFMSSSQEMDQAYFTAPGASIEPYY